MNPGPRQVIILDIEQQAFMALQRVLSDAGIDTTIVGDETTVRQPVGGDYFLEIETDAILEDPDLRLVLYACLMLQGTVAINVTAERAPPQGFCAGLKVRWPGTA